MQPGPNMEDEQNYPSLQKTIQNIAISDLYRSYPMLSFAGQWPFIMTGLTSVPLQRGDVYSLSVKQTVHLSLCLLQLELHV